MSVISVSPPFRKRSSWLENIWRGFLSRRDRERAVNELEPLTDIRLCDIGVSRSDIATRFDTEMRKVERLGLTDCGRC